MSELRSKYPQAQAWTFVLSDTSPPRTKQPTAAGRSSSSCATTVVKSKAASIENEGNVTMGTCCSSKAPYEANKENAGRPVDFDALLARNTGQGSSSRSVSNPAANATNTSTPTKSRPNIDSQGNISVSAEKNQEAVWPTENGRLEGDGVLDSTSLMSPESSLPSARGSDQIISSVNSGSQSGEEGIGDTEDGDTSEVDRSEWLARSIRKLKAGGSVDMTRLKQYTGLESCLYELLADRARYLKAIESLTSQLVKSEAETEKRAQERKALAARLVLVEQEKSSVEQRSRAAAEEHRAERARWQAHKQELETRCVQLEGRDTQYRAALRKKDGDYAKLQESMRRAAQKESRSSSTRGIETTFELTPATRTGNGNAPLGGLMNEHSRRRTEELEKENASLRSMLVDLQSDVIEVRKYQERHGELRSASRAIDSGVWSGESATGPLPKEAIEGMPLEWLQERLGEETARQVLSIRGALLRVLGEGDSGPIPPRKEGVNDASDSVVEDLSRQLKEARALLREQDVIMLAAIFDKPGAESAIAAARQRCVCGGGQDPDGYLGSMIWDTHEHLDQEREDLERQRVQLEEEKARFLEEALQRDNKSFEFECPPATPAGKKVATTFTPKHLHRHMAGAGTLMVSASPCPSPDASSSRARERNGLTMMTFTPPGASPHTTRLLGALGIKPGDRSPYQ